MVLFCIYILVGSRVLNILINPKYDSVRGSSVDLKKYVTLNFSLFSRSSNKTMNGSNSTLNKNSSISRNRESTVPTLKRNRSNTLI
ncbi:hypothetical protein LY90DRAFT_703604 [Neocallimastix californiae]|uniref:Uncharacterized protein n=1 Tax=Neocallimastix californiae TaxID=1754190 RepID=A0A1Y2CDM1_9FUNG|nr:hypothetical protein LY90DRAFT_703604 [Neocallimastix californiae]|eukprot:ORY44987.1 hypothetical protein LY90DRAFT_703604 [Neocallimastix californiae]